MKHHSSRDDIFEQALRAGPPRVEPSIGFAQRIENSWRRAPAEAAPAGPARWWALLSGAMGPAVAFAAMALLVVLIQQSPRIDPNAPSVATVQPVESAEIFTGGSLAALRTSLDGAYEEESRLLMEDTARALRFAASQVLGPETIARMEARGWLTGSGGAEG
jgi:hypothetical protein